MTDQNQNPDNMDAVPPVQGDMSGAQPPDQPGSIPQSGGSLPETGLPVTAQAEVGTSQEGIDQRIMLGAFTVRAAGIVGGATTAAYAALHGLSAETGGILVTAAALAGSAHWLMKEVAKPAADQTNNGTPSQ